MSDRFLRLIATAGLFGAVTVAASAQAMTEAEAVQRFERENARLKGIAAQVREAKAEARSWSLASNPEVTYSREDAAGALDTFLYVGQSVPLSGRLGLMRKAGASASGSAEARGRFETFETLSELRTAFYELLLAQERAALIEAWLGQFRDVVKILREREKENDVSRFDRLRAERELADAESEAAAFQIDLLRAKSRLGAFFGSDASAASLSAKGDFSSVGSLPPLGEVVAKSLAGRGDIRSSALLAERFDFERRAAGRRLVPEPVVAVGMKRTEIPGSSGSGLLLTVSLPVPLFNAGGVESAKAKAAAERSLAENETLRREIAAQVSTAYEAVRIRRKLAEEYARDLGDKGTELSSIGRLAYEEGERGILELLDSHRLALTSKLQAIGLAWAAKQAEIELSRAVGEEVLQ
jgi:cobalt-zinc-cadmium efflux system outer membrane protein